ncbi:endo-1,4-beta-xylanase A precursor partial sequence [Fusibacter sp. 3D3]|nr:endo-1,4-beta-xylanase A precursor partial sequence [Fusibacter sp. 3D3]
MYSTFAGWNTLADGTGTDYAPSATLTMGAGNVTLYAKWIANPLYNVTYDANGSTGGAIPTDLASYYEGDPVNVLGNTGTLVKTNNTFAGWNTASDGTGTNYAPAATFNMGAGNVTLYAKWTEDPKYTVTYDGNGKTGGNVPVDGLTYYSGGSVTVLSNTGTLVKMYSTFAGWNTSADGTGTDYAPAATFNMGAGNVTLYAKWIANPLYNVTYDANGSTGGAIPTDLASYYEGAPVNVLGNTGTLVKTNYTFAGWNTASDGTGTDYAPAATFAMGAGNVTLYAKWTEDPPSPSTYTVTYNGNASTSGSVPVDSSAYQNGNIVTVLGNSGSLTKTNYTFAGWNTASDGTGTDYAPAATFAIGPNNVILYAKWTANPPSPSTYTVAYSGNGSTSGNVPVDSNAYLIGDTVTVSSTTGSMIKAGHTFVNWNTVSDGTGTSYAPSSTFVMGSNNVILYAQWKLDSTFKVIYNGN